MKKFLIMMMCAVGLTGCAEQIDAGNRGVKTVFLQPNFYKDL